MQAISDLNSEEEYDVQNSVKKMTKIEQQNVNMMSPLNMPISHEDYNIKNELDNEYMNPNMMNSPIRNDYSSLNVNINISRKNSNFDLVQPMPPMQHGMYAHNGMMQQISEHMPDFATLDHNHVSNMQSNYGQGSHQVIPDNTGNHYSNMKDYNEMLHDMNMYQKPDKLNMNDKKNEIDEGLQTPPLIKSNSNIAAEPFSPALFVSNQSGHNGMGYLHNIEDLVNDRN